MSSNRWRDAIRLEIHQMQALICGDHKICNALDNDVFVVLCRSLRIKPIGTVEEDIAAMMAGN